jgi:hypothetical protein
MPAVRGENQPAPRAMISLARPEPGRVDLPRPVVKKGVVKSVRLPPHKLIIYPAKDGPVFELFNLKDDPKEKRNLAAEKPELVQQLQKKIDLSLLGTGEKQELSEEDRELLRSLGYTE